MMNAFVMSMKKAPTIGTMRNASGDGPWRSVTDFMIASAQAVDDIPNPICPAAMIAAS
jgi:hypothetical protein